MSSRLLARPTTTIATSTRWSLTRICIFGTIICLSGLCWICLAINSFGSQRLSEICFGSLLLITQFAGQLLNLHYVAEVFDSVSIREDIYTLPTNPISHFPMVSIHVPARSEPVDVLKATLTALANLDYPNYEVLVIDNNTQDENLWRPVEVYCHRLGFRFFHLDHCPGFKAGALNFALNQTSDEASLIAVIDADYIVLPNFLRSLVPIFENTRIAYVQTPHDYRYLGQNLYERLCYLSYRYFFEIALRVRNQRNSIIFVGTMGVLRKEIIQSLGGWDENSITEDAELAVRVARDGWHAVFINQSFGYGLMPFDFEGLKRQRYRWAFGGVRIFNKHRQAFRPSFRHALRTELSSRQKYDYSLGALLWFESVVMLLGTSLTLLMCVFQIFSVSPSISWVSVVLMALPSIVTVFRICVFAQTLKKRTQCSFKEALGAILILTSLSWTVSLACIRALTGERGTFQRTSKFKPSYKVLRTLQQTIAETGLGVLCLAIGLGLIWRYPWSQTSYIISLILSGQACLYLLAPFFALLRLWTSK